MKYGEDFDYLMTFGRFLYEMNNKKDVKSAEQIINQALKENPNYVAKMTKSLINALIDDEKRLKNCKHWKKYREEFIKNIGFICDKKIKYNSSKLQQFL